jgi:RNA polymerase sigma-70 factor (ECF subfamily)
VSDTKPTGAGTSGRDDLYREAVGQYAAGLGRLARAYEADPDLRRDLLQDIHLALWRSFDHFEARCSLRTWTYRVAHNTAMGHVVRQCRKFHSLLTLEQLESAADDTDYERLMNERLAFEQLLEVIHQLRPADRELMLLYLEGLDGPSIAEITGMSPGNVRNQIYRIKHILNRKFHQGGRMS